MWQHAAVVRDQSKQGNGLETAKDLKALDCVAQPGNTEELCKLVLKYPESHSRKTSNFRCSLFLCGSSYLGRQMGTEPLILLWEQGPASNPAMLMAMGAVRWWCGNPQDACSVQEILKLSPREEGVLSKSLERMVHPLFGVKAITKKYAGFCCWHLIVCTSVGSSLSPSRLLEGKASLSHSGSVNARFPHEDFYFAVFLMPGSITFAIGRRGNRRGGITSRCPTGGHWWRTWCQTRCTSLPSKSWREKGKANGACLFSNGPQRQVCIQRVLGVTQIVGLELWNRAGLRESQNEPSDCLGQQRVEIWERPQCCCLHPCSSEAHQGSTPSCSCGAKRTRGRGLGISVGRVSTLDPCS